MALRRVPEPMMTATDPGSLFSPIWEFQMAIMAIVLTLKLAHEEPADSSPGCLTAALWAATSHRRLNELNSVLQSH